LMNMDFVVISPLVLRGMPDIGFLSIGSYVCSTLLSQMTSRPSPCASLVLHLHRVGQGTCTPELLSMLGTQKTAPGFTPGRSVACLCVEERLIFVIRWPGVRFRIQLFRTHAFFESLAFLPSPLEPVCVSALSGCYICNGRARAPGASFDVTCCIWDVVQV
jgi:hypothetical protein